MSRVVALDPGTKRVGVSVSDSARSMAFPRPSISADDHCIQMVVDLVRELGAEVVVVGRPLALAGRVTESTTAADRFREQLATALEDIEVLAMDERLTTVSARERLTSAGVTARDQRDIIDSAAATVLLQGYLDGLVR